MAPNFRLDLLKDLAVKREINKNSRWSSTKQDYLKSHSHTYQ